MLIMTFPPIIVNSFSCNAKLNVTSPTENTGIISAGDWRLATHDRDFGIFRQRDVSLFHSNRILHSQSSSSKSGFSSRFPPCVSSWPLEDHKSDQEHLRQLFLQVGSFFAHQDSRASSQSWVVYPPSRSRKQKQKRPGSPLSSFRRILSRRRERP